MIFVLTLNYPTRECVILFNRAGIEVCVKLTAGIARCGV